MAPGRGLLCAMLPRGNRTPLGTAASVAEFVRRRRKANRLTQAQLALLAGVGRRFVSDLENGKGSLLLDKVDLVLKVFGKRLGLVDRERALEPLELHAAGRVAEPGPTPRKRGRGHG